MGEVYRAHDNHLDRDVAIKVLPAGMLADESARKRFHKEALALSKLNHPNIATIYVNRHGALISTAVALGVGMKIEIRVILTDKRAFADVVYVDPDQPRLCWWALRFVTR
jgi:hypothetical protein